MTHLHRNHPCTYPAPYLHWPAWYEIQFAGSDPYRVTMMLNVWWPQRRPR